MSEEAPAKGSTSWLESLKMGRVFWLLCSMEMWERLAYYGLRVVVPIYIAQADEPGGLHFSQVDKGFIYFWWAMFQSVLPSFTGGLADRYGYKPTIFIAITLKVIGYVLMGTQRSFYGFMAGVLFLATGTALFKPGIQGSLAQSLPKEKASSGWGVFYWLVNVGALLGPPLAGMLKKLTWPWVFYGCAIIVSINYLMMFTYKDPESGADNTDNLGTVMVDTLKNLLDARLIGLLLILSGFWMMMYQLWDLHPNFIRDWIDSNALSTYVPGIWTRESDRGTQVLQENLLNLNAAVIVIAMIPLSVIVRKMRTLRAMLLGMIIATAGIVVSGTMSGWVLLLAILLFSTGEMLTGPKKLELFGLIAPPGKKALYLGYVNIPVGIGQGIGGLLMGNLYGNYGEKSTLAARYLAEKTDFLASKGLPAWDGNISTLEASLGVKRAVAYETMKAYASLDGHQATQLLWDTYHPYYVWYVLAGVGVLSAIALIIFIRLTADDDRMNV
jgi:proton-dependent oligopeptide transporter, POT family